MQEGPLYTHSTGKLFTHADMVQALRKDPQAIIDSLTPQIIDAMYAAAGLAGEAGEVLDEVKKAFAYARPIDRDKVIKEMGDAEFYFEQLRAAIGVTRQEVLDTNVEKLVLGASARYPNLGYSDAEAIARRDVAPTLRGNGSGEPNGN